MTALVVLTVGTQEVQGDWFTPREVSPGPGAHLPARQFAAELEKADDAYLKELVSYEALRNGPCFAEIGRRHPEGWTLVLISTDQPEGVADKFRDADTYPLACQLRRWFALSHPQVTVVEPDDYKVALNPADPSDELAAELLQKVRLAIETVQPTSVVLLSVGATPALRVLTERALGLVYKGDLSRLQPDPAGDGCLATSLLRLVEGERVELVLKDQYERALYSGRYRAAEETAQSMAQLGLPQTDVLAAWARTGAKIAGNEAGWFAPGDRGLLDAQTCRQLSEIRGKGDFPQIGARVAGGISAVRRAHQDGRLEEALGRWSATAELLPLLWLTRLAGHELTAPEVCNAFRGADRCLRPRPGAALAPPQNLPRARDRAQHAAGVAFCASATSRCDYCPLGRGPGPTWSSPAAEDQPGASLALQLRYTGPQAVYARRNYYVHAHDPAQSDIALAVHAEKDALKRWGIRAGADLASLLEAVAVKLAGGPLPGPLDIVDEAVGALWRGQP